MSIADRGKYKFVQIPLHNTAIATIWQHVLAI
jgi:hypothetical protein